jgi:hypothetical protein
MPKPTRGLPRDFQLNVPAAPVHLGDYLEEQAASPVVKPPAPAEQPKAEPAAILVSVAREAVPAAAARGARPGAPPRKQFNMTPETLKMVDDLLIHIRNHSAERDVRASELFHALVLAVHEVQPLLDLSRIPQRGRWGSATAAALPVAMKEVFQEAIARARRRERG